MHAMGSSTQAEPDEVPSSMPRIIPRTHPGNTGRTRFPLAKSAYLRGKFAHVASFLLLSHEDAPRAAQVKPDTWLWS